MNANSALTLAGLAVLIPKLPSLWKVSDENGKFFLRLHALGLILYNRLINLSEDANNKAIKLITVNTILILLYDKFMNKITNIIRLNLAISMIPLINDAVKEILSNGLDGLLNSSEIDVPALVSMNLGLTFLL